MRSELGRRILMLRHVRARREADSPLDSYLLIHLFVTSVQYTIRGYAETYLSIWVKLESDLRVE